MIKTVPKYKAHALCVEDWVPTTRCECAREITVEVDEVTGAVLGIVLPPKGASSDDLGAIYE